ncbi:MAG: ABC transporter substrate-binding protein [Cetobacterium sp.]|uniref:ABC transporter substrate-binding protein n=1 Tax=Cetobacterium sp. TaxID=2071632 RepID=UPI003EE6D522
MNIVPGLAESWEKIDERKTIFNLRKNVKFHNGETLTAKDVKFTLDRMFLKANPDYYLGKTPIESVIIKSIPEGTNRTIAIGSIEYHGAQAPLGTDYIIPKLSYKYSEFYCGLFIK